MISEVTTQRLNQLYPDFRVRVYRTFESVYLNTKRRLNSTETLRPLDRQKHLYEQGRTLIDGKWKVTDKKLIVTNAPPGFSLHAYGLANDSCWAGKDPYLDSIPKPEAKKLWDTYGRMARSYGCVWGGDWNGNNTRDANDFDLPHIEMSYGLTLHELIELHNHGGLQAVWAELDKIRGVPIASDWKLSDLPSNV